MIKIKIGLEQSSAERSLNFFIGKGSAGSQKHLSCLEVQFLPSAYLEITFYHSKPHSTLYNSLLSLNIFVIRGSSLRLFKWLLKWAHPAHFVFLGSGKIPSHSNSMAYKY